MRQRESALITEIERDAVDERVPLAGTLRKCVLLGARTGSTKLREWASRELNGYSPEDDDQLPEWRRVPTPIQIDGIRGNFQFTGQTVSRYFLPEFARDAIKEEVTIFWGVGELEAMVRNADERVIRLGPHMSSELVTYMNAKNNVPFQHIERLYWAVSVTAIQGVLDRGRSELIELVAELRHAMPEGAKLPTATAATQAVNVVGTGDGGNVTNHAPVASGNFTSTIARPSEPPGRRKWEAVAI